MTREATTARISRERALIGIAAAAAVCVYALRNGTYDIVARSEAAIVMWWVVLLGLLVGVLPRRRPGVGLAVAMGGFALLALWTALAFGWTQSDERTAVELGRVLHHAVVLLFAACLVTRRTWTAGVAGLAAGMALVTWLALVAWLWPETFPVDDVRKTLPGDNHRLSYPLDYWNGMGFFGAMAVLATLAFASHARSVLWRAAAAAQAPAAAAVIYLTYSRGAVGALIVGLVVLVAFSRSRWGVLAQTAAAGVAALAVISVIRDQPEIVRSTGSEGAETVLLAVVGAGVVCGLVAVALHRAKLSDVAMPRKLAGRVLIAGIVVALIGGVTLGPAAGDRLWDSFTGDEIRNPADPAARLANLGGARDEQFASALDAFRRDPWQGTGPGTYEFTWNRDPRYTGFVRDVHSLYLEALAETGVPGLIALLVAIGGAILILIRAALATRDRASRGAVAAAASLFGCFLAASAIDWTWELTALPAIALAAVGFASVASARTMRPVSRLRSWPVRAAGALMCLLALLVIVVPMASTSSVRDSQRAATLGDLEAAVASAEAAVEVAPWAASPLVQRALLAEQAGDLAAAAADLAFAVEREPTNWRIPLILARVEARRGRTAQSLRWFRRARSLAPLSPAFG